MRSNASRFLRIFVFASTLLCAAEGMAGADVLPPEFLICSGAPAGVGCTNQETGAKGTCEPARCQEKDYASWDRDASPRVVPTKERDCLRCSAGGGYPTSSSARPTGDETDGEDGSGGCSVSGTTRTTAPWLLALAAALIVTVVRRKRVIEGGS